MSPLSRDIPEVIGTEEQPTTVRGSRMAAVVCACAGYDRYGYDERGLDRYGRRWEMSYSTYEAVRVGERPQNGSPRLQRPSFQSILTDERYNWQVWQGNFNVQRMITEMRKILMKEVPFRLTVSQPNIWGHRPLTDLVVVMTVLGILATAAMPLVELTARRSKERELKQAVWEIRRAIEEPVNAIVDAVKDTLDKTPPELSADIAEHGIMLTGGGALLAGLDERIKQETGMPVLVADQPLQSVVIGAGRCLEEFETLRRVLISSTRHH